jgi:hypothetical protein
MTAQTKTDITTPRACTRCNGTGITHSQWAKDRGSEGPEGRPCHTCKAKGSFEGLDIQGIVDIILTKRGNKRSFRKSFPSNLDRYGNVLHGRAYYVWRLARFHGGKDVTMPMTADMILHGDPFKKELDQLADVVAKHAFGTNMAAAARWGMALGFIKSAPEGLPASAYEGGPVADENKPKWEQLEIM